MAKKETKKIEIKVSQYVEMYNSVLKSGEKPINRHYVYNLIKAGHLEARKGYKGAWFISIEDDKKEKKKKSKKTKKKKPIDCSLTTKEYVELYNEKFPYNPITGPEVRKLIIDGKIKAEKVGIKWIIKEYPRNKRKNK